LDIDMNGGGGRSKEPVENVFFGDSDKGIEAPRGLDFSKVTMDADVL